MATAVKRAQGTLLKLDDGAGNFTTIAELTNITATESRDELDASNHDTATADKEYVPGMAMGEIAIEGNFLPNNATQDHLTGILAILRSSTSRNFKAIYPVSPTWGWIWLGFLRDMVFQAPVAGLMTFTASVRRSGTPTYTATP